MIAATDSRQLPPKTKVTSVEYVSSGTPLTWQVR
jgi:hypothetical protein